MSFSHAAFFGDINSAVSDELLEDLAVLKRANIQSKSEFREWCLRNHPDKNPDPPIDFHIVVEAGQKVTRANVWPINSSP